MTRRVEVLETLVDHGLGAFCFVEASFSGLVPPLRPRLRQPLEVTFEALPTGVRSIVADGLWRLRQAGEQQIVEHSNDPDHPRPEVLDPPQGAASVIRGVVADPSGHWLRRRFEVTLARGEVLPVEMFPSPAAVPRGPCVHATLRWTDDRPAAFARVELAVDAGPVTHVVLGRCDANGDVVLSLRRVPVRAPGIPKYPARLRVSALPFLPGVVDDALRPDADLVPCEIGRADQATFAPVFAIDLDPALVTRAASHDEKLLRIRSQP